jgi:hypothetical protein
MLERTLGVLRLAGLSREEAVLAIRAHPRRLCGGLTQVSQKSPTLVRKPSNWGRVVRPSLRGRRVHLRHWTNR